MIHLFKWQPLCKAMTLIYLASCGASPQKSPDQTQEPDSYGAYKIEFSDVMEFARGVDGSYSISGYFVAPGDGELTIDGLPPGATFADGQLLWQPSCDLKPENGQFLRGYMVHRLRINLRSLTTDNLVQKPAIVIVHMHGEGSVCED